MKDCTIIEVIHATHQQSDVRYGTPSGMQGLFMTLWLRIWLYGA